MRNFNVVERAINEAGRRGYVTKAKFFEFLGLLDPTLSHLVNGDRKVCVTPSFANYGTISSIVLEVEGSAPKLSVWIGWFGQSVNDPLDIFTGPRGNLTCVSTLGGEGMKVMGNSNETALFIRLIHIYLKGREAEFSTPSVN